MKILINKHQLQLLTNNFVIIESGGLGNKSNLINEGRNPEYLVSMLVSSYYAQIRITTSSGSGGAMAIARKLFPNARIYSAKSA